MEEIVDFLANQDEKVIIATASLAVGASYGIRNYQSDFVDRYRD
ncbi:MAG: hypothetical protein ABEJ56_03095 [Candidatus Nanohaloarchaea archaeon]